MKRRRIDDDAYSMTNVKNALQESLELNKLQSIEYKLEIILNKIEQLASKIDSLEKKNIEEFSYIA